MKKISLYAAALVALGAGFSACDQLHNDLRLEVPTSYVLDTPSNAGELIIFGTSDSNVDNEWSVVTKYPFNVQTQADFQVQVAKSVADFETWDNLIAEDSSNTNPTDSEGIPYAAFVSGIFTSPSFTVDGAYFCDAINQVYGFETEDQIADAGPIEVAYRVYAWVPGVEYSFIFSNPVVLSQVQSYIPIFGARKIYIVGAPQGWDINGEDMFVSETDPGSNIYTGSINVSQGEFMFRFYSVLGDWDANSIGSQVEDNPVTIEPVDNVYEGPAVEGKGSWSYPDWEGGAVDITLDMNAMTVTFTLRPGEEAPEVPTGNIIYLIGKPQGWDINSDEMWLQETEEGSNVFERTLNIKSGEFQFRFYTALGDWDANSLGSQVEDNPVTIEFTDEVYTGPMVDGKGSWSDPTWGGGALHISVDINTMTVTMTIVEAGEPVEPEVDDSIYIRGGMNGWGTEADWKFLPTNIEGVFAINNVTIPANEQFKVADANWGSINYGVPGEEDGVVVPVGQDIQLLSNGKNMMLAEAFTGSVVFDMSDPNAATLLLTTSPVETVEYVDIYLRGNMNEWGTPQTWQFQKTSEENVYILKNVSITGGVTFKVADANWGACNFGTETSGEELNIGESYNLIYNAQDFCLSSDFTGNVTVTYIPAESSMSIIFTPAN